MSTIPSGILSLTYHLAYDQFYRDLWLKGDYAKCFSAFGITNADTQEAIRKINSSLGTASGAQRDQLIDQWTDLIGTDIKTAASNPQVLW